MRPSILPEDPVARAEYIRRRNRRYQHKANHTERYNEVSSVDYVALGCIIDKQGRPRYPEPRKHTCELCGKDFMTKLPAQHCCCECQESPDFAKRWCEKHPIVVTGWQSVAEMMERRRG